MRKKKKTEKLEHLVSDISQWMKEIQTIPAVLADRALKVGALSFLALFLGAYVGRENHSTSFILWSVAICLFGMGYAFCLLRCGRKQEYETIEGYVCELKGRHSIGRVYHVGVQLEDGRVAELLLDKQYRFRLGRRYRFYFNRKGQSALFGIRSLDAALHIDSFYGAEELK